LQGVWRRGERGRRATLWQSRAGGKGEGLGGVALPAPAEEAYPARVVSRVADLGEPRPLGGRVVSRADPGPGPAKRFPSAGRRGAAPEPARTRGRVTRTRSRVTVTPIHVSRGRMLGVP
jgi:hypothetical protein